MIVAYICGGLGNQMFQYAAARRLALHRGTDLRLDLREYATGADDRGAAFADYRRPVRLYELRVAAPAATAADIARVADRFRTRSTRDRVVRQVRRRLRPGWLWPATHVREAQYRFDPSVLDLPADAFLDGFWQSWRYFADAADAVRADLQPKDDAIPAYARAYVARLRALDGPVSSNGPAGADTPAMADCPVVSVHVRRGDLAHAVETLNDPALVYGLPVGLDYIRAAMARFPAGVRFLVFSDTPRDLAWCRQHLPAVAPDPARLHYADGHTDVQDMALMTACDHHVIANSTFSWWAAWLDAKPGRRVVAPVQWAQPGYPKPMPTDDLIPPDWERA